MIILYISHVSRQPSNLILWLRNPIFGRRTNSRIVPAEHLLVQSMALFSLLLFPFLLIPYFSLSLFNSTRLSYTEFMIQYWCIYTNEFVRVGWGIYIYTLYMNVWLTLCVRGSLSLCMRLIIEKLHMNGIWWCWGILTLHVDVVCDDLIIWWLIWQYAYMMEATIYKVPFFFFFYFLLLALICISGSYIINWYVDLTFLPCLLTI